jgi:hypothetical protein
VLTSGSGTGGNLSAGLDVTHCFERDGYSVVRYTLVLLNIGSVVRYTVLWLWFAAAVCGNLYIIALQELNLRKWALHPRIHVTASVCICVVRT